MTDESGAEPPVPPGVDSAVPSPARLYGLAEYAKATENIHLRPWAEVARFFAGLDLVPPWPGEQPRLVFMGEWGAEDPESADSDGSHWSYAGVARVP